MINRGRKCGEDVGIPVVQNVLLDFRDALGVQVTLDAVKGLHLAVIEDGDTLHHSIRPHGDVVDLVGLEASNDGESDGWDVSIHGYA